MQLELIGPHPFEVDAQGRQMSRIGSLFPSYGALWTQLPGVHAVQRLGFIERVNAERTRKELPPLSREEEEGLSAGSVDLIFEPDHILIRPNPERMDLAFMADEMLQDLVSKRQVKFLSVADRRVREAIRHHGEYWRLSAIPKTREAKERMVFSSKVAISGEPIYYYNRLTGTRWLTCQELDGLGKLDDASLARHLQEIADHAVLRNHLGRPEVDFFAADLRRFGTRQFLGVAYDQLPAEQVRARFEELRARFRSAVHEGYWADNCNNTAWCERMLSALFLEGNEAQSEQILSGLSPEFFLQIEWLPGGRFEEGEFLFDSIFDEAANRPEDAELQRLCDPRAKGIIFNLIREYGDLEFVNVGCLPESLSLDRPQKEGRRGVFLAEFHSRSERATLKRFLRLQKWGVWEHLDEGKDLLQSIKESEDYTDFWLDRRLGCRQLGMNLTRRVAVRRLSEIYGGTNARFQGELIRTIYSERQYVPGVATDKVSPAKYSRPGYSLRLAELLGRAAVSSIIVGRALENGTRPVFDDGDEVVREGEDGLPAEIMVGDHSGAFGEYKLPLENFAFHYARPINIREKAIPELQEFAIAYLKAFREQFLRIQGDYRKRRRAFDTLFKHCRYDQAGSFAYRWECVLRRLDQTNPYALVDAIRQQVHVLNRGAPSPDLINKLSSSHSQANARQA
ncbi:MAG TPA: hypothetical protein P5205_19400 [Candidatus Paceibacterota bacterium]|nr:hypothetical protein [Verrucomicrobiota bacterium]HSA12531.1 hypothetical protein [Candidatus Paceibacterota bacterium]